MRIWLAGFVGVLTAAASIPLVRGAVRERRATDEMLQRVEAGAYPDLAILEPDTLAALEREGLTLGALLGSADDAASLHAHAPAYRAIAQTLEADLRELAARPRVGDKAESPNHAFRASWLADERARYDLIGAVFRPDRVTGDAARAWGELRLVFRLTLTPKNRPATRLPMTVNVLFAASGQTAEDWQMLPPAGLARVKAVRALFRGVPLDQIEVNLQNLHGPSLREDQDDHAEYLLRAFDVTRVGATPRKLFNTPREDLSPADRAELATWVKTHLGEIDQGEHTVPEKFLATRAISVTPRGLARPQNRAFARALGDQGKFANVSFVDQRMVTSEAALMRRLEEGTCTGCHQTRSIAGFHLLGTERDRGATFNALALAGSPHFHDDMTFRAAYVDAKRGGARSPARPFTFRREQDEGRNGAACGATGSPFARYGCAPGLACVDLDHDQIGVCAPSERGDGDMCQSARVESAPGADGDRVIVDKAESCRGEDASCSPNGFGFHGGLCSSACSVLGERHGESVCADLPAAGYESECFFTKEPIENCMARNAARRRVAHCDVTRPCRADFACARVPGLPEGEGACAPPYFLFQARIDGPSLDR